ncbi:MAG: AAA family ATPase [Clostridia bacterium]|nr:AAA family ATPase [Clostridia bacterium]
MKDQLDGLNIPTFTVEEMVERLSFLYENAVLRGIRFQKLPTPFLWGAPGVGKSDGVRQLAQRLEKATGKRVKVTDVRLLLFSPVDLRGVPTPDENRRFTNWLMPRIFQMEEGEAVINVLFLDELSAAPVSVQAAAYQICLDRRIGEHVLPENCIVIAAGNRTTDGSVSYKMPKALCNRLMHFQVAVDFEAWRSWAVRRGIDPKVIAFLRMDPARLCVEPESSELAYCSPRSWEFVSTLLETVGDDPGKIRDLIAACVGVDTALELEAFCKGLLKIPDPELILAGKSVELPRGYDVTYALLSALVARLGARGKNVTVEELEHVCFYVRRLPKDFALTFFRDIRCLPEMDGKLMKCHSFQSWLNQNRA